MAAAKKLAKDLVAGDVVPVPAHERAWMKRGGYDLEVTVLAVEPSSYGVWTRVVAEREDVEPRWLRVKVAHRQIPSFGSVRLRPDSIVRVLRGPEGVR